MSDVNIVFERLIKVEKDSFFLPTSCDTVQIKEELEEELPLPECVTVGFSLEDGAGVYPLSQDLDPLSDPLSDLPSASVKIETKDYLEDAESPFPFPVVAVAEQVDLKCERKEYSDAECAEETKQMEKAGAMNSNEYPDQGSVCRKNIRERYLSNKNEFRYDERPLQYCIRQDQFNSQMNSHSCEKAVQCCICKKEFIDETSPSHHMRSHTPETPFECSICKKKFCQKSDLNSHMRFHTYEKSFLCSFCGRLFSQKRYMMSHMRSHSSEKPRYQCSICSQEYCLKRDLITHMRFHSSDKPLYRCSYCREEFSHKHYLKSHMSIHMCERAYRWTTVGYVPASDSKFYTV